MSLPKLARLIWQLLDAAQRRECAYVLGISIAAGCFTVAGVVGIAPFLAVLADPGVVERNPALAWIYDWLGFSSNDAFVVSLGVAFVALLVLANFVNLLAILAMGRFSHHVGARFHVLLFEEYLRRDFRFHTRSNSDVLATHVVHDVNRTVGGIIQSGLSLIAGTASILLIAAAVVVVNPVVALGAAMTLGLSYAAIYAVVRRRLLRHGANISQLWSLRAKVIAESFEAIKDIILFRAQREMSAQVARHSEAIAHAHASTAAIAATPKYLLECVTAAGLVASALWIYRTTGPGQWLAHLAMLGLAAYRLLPPIQQVFVAVARIRSDGASFLRIAEDLRCARQHTAPEPTRAPSEEWAARPRHDIRLVGVSYRHSPERAGGVSDISLQIPARALIGLAGPNGSGKSTLADLILGVLVPDAGRIEIDGVPLDDQNRGLWLSSVAHVPQHIVLLDASIAQNVAFGVPPEDVDVARARDALDDVGLGSLADALPAGLSTGVGQHGMQLSGGQRQRIGIARALYRGASLFVLDEATSGLDTAAEADIIALLDGLRSKCTIVLIAHRPSSLQSCDVVFELAGGRLAGRGTGDSRRAQQATHRAGSAP
jgi:ABC-type multidrug transport system fused ATPase/permease subunit